jgi:hypothetical protein
MFQRLQYILLFVVFVVFVFFVVSTFTFTGRLAEGTGFIIPGYGFPTYRILIQIMRQRAGEFVGGFSTVGCPCSTSSPSGSSPTYGGHRPTTADKSSSFIPTFLVLIFSRDIYIVDV